MIFPLLLLMALVLIFPLLDRRKLWPRLLAVGLIEWATCRYLWFRWSETFPTSGGWVYGYQLAFLIVESLALGLTILVGILILRLRERTPEVDVLERQFLEDQNFPTVDVIIPTYGEPESVLRRTVEGCVRILWPRDRLRILFLDDGNRPWLKEMCAQYGVDYLVRPNLGQGGKAGNLNYGLVHSNGDFICGLDADFIPSPRILTRLVALCGSEPDIGLAQTPQHFDNPDAVQWNLFAGPSWTEEQRFFCDVIQPARDAWGASFCIGTGWVARRAAINAIGGAVPEDTVCEDMYTTYNMMAAGYRTVYLNEALAYGLAAESITEFIGQRVRWCQGTVQTLWAKLGMLRHPALSPWHRILYIDLVWYWFGFTFLMFIFVSPVFYWFFAVPIFESTLDQVVNYLLPRMITVMGLMWWFSDGRILPVVTDVKKAVCMPFVAPAFWAAFVRPDKLTFRVTAKGQVTDRPMPRWNLMWPHIALMVALIVGVGMNLRTATMTVDWDHHMAMNAILTIYCFVVSMLCCLACVDQPKTEGYWDRGQPLSGNPIRGVWAMTKRWFGTGYRSPIKNPAETKVIVPH